MNIRIIPMETGHIAAVAKIEEESFSMPWSEAAFEESMSYEHTIFLVAVDEDNGNVLGYAGMYKVFNQGDITNVAVSPVYRRMGVAESIMKELIRQAKQSGILDLMLEVRQSNHKAIHLYEKIGFKNIGIRKNFYEKPVENAIIMTIALDGKDKVEMEEKQC